MDLDDLRIIARRHGATVRLLARGGTANRYIYLARWYASDQTLGMGRKRTTSNGATCERYLCAESRLGALSHEKLIAQLAQLPRKDGMPSAAQIEAQHAAQLAAATRTADMEAKEDDARLAAWLRGA